MDVELILEGIFGEYRKKCIAEGKNERIVEKHLESVRNQVEDRIRNSLGGFLGMPINDRTRMMMRDTINQNIQQFLDTDIRIDSIEDSASDMTINMTYKPKYPIESIKL